MFNPSSISPDVELAEALKGAIYVDGYAGSGSGEATGTVVPVYSDWEHPTNDLSTDFIICYLNGDAYGVGMETSFASGYIMVSLYCKMNDDGSVKKNRIKKILEQFDAKIEGLITSNYVFKYDSQRFITPTTPNMSSGYSITTLNLRWTTNSNFNI